jgi:hypothetical protein
MSDRRVSRSRQSLIERVKRDLLGKGTRHGNLLDGDDRDGPVDHDDQHDQVESDGNGRERHFVWFVWGWCGGFVCVWKGIWGKIY